MTVDTHNLAKSGFTAIRNLLEGREKGGSEAALALAEALHNLPERENRFCHELVLEGLIAFGKKYPHLKRYYSPFIEDEEGLTFEKFQELETWIVSHTEGEIRNRLEQAGNVERNNILSTIESLNAGRHEDLGWLRSAFPEHDPSDPNGKFWRPKC